jgi:hypothetical protein
MSSRLPPSSVRIDDLGLTRLIGRPLLSKEAIVVNTPLALTILRLLLGVSGHQLEFSVLVDYISRDRWILEKVGGASAKYRILGTCLKLSELGLLTLE